MAGPTRKFARPSHVSYLLPDAVARRDCASQKRGCGEPNGKTVLPMLGSLRFLNVDRRVRNAAPGQPDRRKRRTRPFPAAMQLEALDARQLLSAGDLDASFGTGGRVSLDFGSGDDFGYAVAVQ